MRRDPTQRISRRRRLVRAVAIAILVAGSIELLVRSLGLASAIGPSLTIGDPLLGKRLRPGLECTRTTADFAMRFTTNRDGWRGPQRRAGTAAVVVLGDETTLGYGVDDGSEYPRVLERELHALGHDVDVVAMGLPDNASGRALLLLQDEVARLSPRLVVLQCSADDFRDNGREALFALTDDGELSPLPIPGRSLARTLQSTIESLPLVSRSHAFCWLRQLVAASEAGVRRSAPLLTGGTLADESADPLTTAILEASLATCARAGWPVVVVTDPAMRAPEHAAVRELCGRRSARLTSIPDRRVHREAFIAATTWLSADGHSAVAAALRAAILSPPALLR